MHKASLVALSVGFDMKALVSVLAALEHPKELVTSA